MTDDVCESTAADNDQRKILSKILECNEVSKYLVGPNRRFKKAVRIFAFALSLIDKAQKKLVICQPGNK